MFITVGEAILRFRTIAGVRQEEAARRLGVTRDKFGRWERNEGRPPTLEETEAIARALMLSNRDRARLLMAGQFLPNEEEIADITNRLSASIATWPHLAYIFDYSGRIISTNRGTVQGAHLTGDTDPSTMPTYPNLLELIFDHRYTIRSYLDEFGAFERTAKAEIDRFKSAHAHALGAKWMTELLYRLNRLPGFYELWNTPPSDDLEHQYWGLVSLPIRIGHKGEPLEYLCFRTESCVDPRFSANFFVPRKAIEIPDAMLQTLNTSP